MKRFRCSLLLKTTLFLIIVFAANTLSCINGNMESEKILNYKSNNNISELIDKIKSADNKLDNKFEGPDPFADWRLPCKKLTPMLAVLSVELIDTALIYKIDFDNNPGIRHFLHVTGIPGPTFQAAIYGLQYLALDNEYKRTVKRFQDNSSNTSSKIYPEPDGKIINGLRVIQLSTNSPPGNIYVYRGEKVKLIIKEIKYPYSIHIPEYNISSKGIVGKKLEVVFKAKNIGVFQISCTGKCAIGEGAQYGQITVMQYKSNGAEKYIEVNAKQAKKIIEKINPLILDVRTPDEFYSGHIKNAKLIPLSRLEQRVSEIINYKNKDILIYCRSGNRSTVAAEILIKHGFKKIYNLRTGIKDWIKEGNEVIE